MTAPARRALVVAVVVAMPAVVGRAAPGILTQYRALVLCFGVTYVIAALPLNLLMGYAGQISLGHAAFLGAGAYTSGIVAGRLGLPFVLGLLVAAAVGAAAAMVIGLPALRIRGLYLALVTLGFGLAMTSMVFRLRSVTGGYAGLAVPRPQAGSFVFTRNADLLALVVAVAVVVWLLDANLTRSTVGRAFRAIRSDEDVAAATGIDVARYKLYAFTLYGALSAVAGSVLGHVIGFAQTETFTFDLSLLFVVMVVLGGQGSRAGVAAVALVFGAAPRFFTVLRGWDLVLAPVAVLITLVRHPGGLGESVTGLRRERAAAPRRAGDDDAVAPTLVLPTPLRGGGEHAVSGSTSPLEVVGVSVRFGGVAAVDDVTLEVRAGEITGLIGPNGAGKTTLFNAVSGLVTPSAGRVIVGGDDVTAFGPHRRARAGIGRTFQHIGLVKDLTVHENLLLAQHRLAGYTAGAALAGLPHVRRRERAMAASAHDTLAALGFDAKAHHELRLLSHGQQRIVELAAALMTAPQVLLLDEPSAGMSPAAAEALAARLLQVRDELGQTILLIEHHLPLVMTTCTTVHVMDAGRLLRSGPPGDIRRDPSVVAAYLGERVA